ncbi:hypothetical protein GA0070616_3199 [Micromonospora nigra]|uniref:Uncharacterized protein n=1 Tax=Micromonospora nigra TaxID=145857 RepID=A0A1C6S8T4_9ACTN|nr:hypothetical protein GA0070616_3199 [Micromonospora nigra]
MASRYLETVQRIAPQALVGREAELAELAAFCTGQGEGWYRWWRAPAWTGKSALMSWFVLNPPDGVRVVSFFITARFAEQNDRVAFTDVVMEQLLDLLGQEKPPLLAKTTREAHLFGLINEAAQACQLQGERLILLVDGLDEDRGVTTGADAHSIAKLLPATPVAGMRVIVSGRPNPPIPDDVPQNHPLRDVRIVRTLGRSSAAATIKGEAKRELKRLLNGSRIERDLLGLLTAAGGGLGAESLAELAGVEPWEVEEQLHSVSGRTFATRHSRFQPETGPEVFVLGHEELQVVAAERMGPALLAGYREQLHVWAEGYRQQGWPEGTPEYLLRGYYRMLQADGDLTRMIAYATDTARQDRMLDITGGDAAALSEIVAAQDVILANDKPDLGWLLLLSMHRNDLADRNNNIPTDLPSVWARLGQPNRADALARSITNSYRQTQALAALAETVAVTRGVDRARAIVDRAEALAHSISDPYQQAQAMTSLAKAVAVTGRVDRAETIASSITNSYRQTQALAALAEAVAVTGRVDRAQALVDRAEALAHSISDPYQQAQAMTSLAKAVAVTGRVDRAETIASSITNPDGQAWALTALANAIAATGNLDRAETIASSITNPNRHAQSLTALAKAAATIGNFDRARLFAHQAETIARNITNADRVAWALTALTRAVAVTGNLDRAETIAYRITNPNQQARALTALANAVTATGDLDRARALVNQVETIALTIADPFQQAWALTALAKAVAATGNLDRAETIARNVTNPSEQTRALTALAETVAATGNLDRARALVDRAEALTRHITNPDQRAQAMTALAKAVTATGDLDRAETISNSITDSYPQMQALAALAETVAATGNLDRARALVDRAEALTRHITNPDQRAQAMTALAKAVTATGDLDRAETISNSITDPDQQAQALIVVATACVEAEAGSAPAGLYSLGAGKGTGVLRARSLAAAALAQGSWDRCLDIVARIQPNALLDVSSERMLATRWS